MADFRDEFRFVISSLYVQVLCITVLALSFSLFFIRRASFEQTLLQGFFKSRAWKLPPGPSAWPILGCLPQFQRARRSAIDLSDWVRETSEIQSDGPLMTHQLASLAGYGEMTTLKMGAKTCILLNNNRVVTEIISKRGNITGERPYLPVASGLVSRHKRTLLRQTAQWTEGRRVMQRLLNGTALETYGGWQELESVQLLAACLYRPHRWNSHHLRYSVSVMHQIVFGHRLLKSTPELEDFVRAAREFVLSINASVVDFFPWLARIPSIFWRSHWARMGQAHYNIYLNWWRPIKQAFTDGTAPASFTRDVLLNRDTGYTGNDEDAMYLSTSIIGAGSDSPKRTLNTFVMAALCYPEAILKARKEIDAVCGSQAERLPNILDMAKMSYVCAIIKELLRWRPSVLIVPPHELTQGLQFEGYYFPKGTNFLINCIAVCNECENPEEFEPERWLDEHVENVLHGLWQFGGGRRVCVGYKVAQQGLFVAIARLIYCFDYVATGPYDSRCLHHERTEEPFPVKISIRSNEHENLIIQEATRCAVLDSAKVDF